jgi:multidrug efflux pump subunit AcrB
VAYRNYIIPAFRAWLREPDNTAAIARRNEFMERFDRGVVLEHVAFPLVLASGLLMVWLAGWSWQGLNWLSMKLGIVLIIFVPIETVDYYISHLGGNKRKIRATGNTARYEAMTRFHWQFFRLTTPLIVVLVPLVFYLAVTKPV